MNVLLGSGTIVSSFTSLPNCGETGLDVSVPTSSGQCTQKCIYIEGK